MLGDRDTQTILDGKKKLNFMNSQAVGMQKLSDFPWLLSTSAISSTSTPYEPPGETLTT